MASFGMTRGCARSEFTDFHDFTWFKLSVRTYSYSIDRLVGLRGCMDRTSWEGLSEGFDHLEYGR